MNDDHHHLPPSHSASVAIAMQDDRARTPDDEDDDDDDEDDSMHNDIGEFESYTYLHIWYAVHESMSMRMLTDRICSFRSRYKHDY